ncbi:fatty acyl-CoA reductase wat-like [Planococcus citri]|uniref:fatty acyl-CoA reductase wat-like n=1 Tax=Planococcus citri TaxID=170843 RepID=UPI0031F948EA
MLSEVQSFYYGKKIFITGATGFLGQMLISKLLCSCPEIDCIYILIREKSGKTIQDRIKAIFNHPIFERAKELHPDYETKVKPIRGDCYEEYLGISEKDQAIIEDEVDIIFHIASLVNFNAPLRSAGYINIRSLDNLFEIARKMIKLKAFVYVSTAYSACMETKFIQEEFYEPPVKPRKLLSLIEHLDDDVLDEVAPRLAKSYPNRYVFTKLIAEDLCRENTTDLPVCVFRPAGVLPCFKEPLPGWINNSYGVIGFFFGFALGITKVACVNESCRACVVPGDYSTNALILSAYHMSKSWKNKSEEHEFDTPIINYSNCTTNFKVTWGSFQSESNRVVKKYPFYNMVALPNILLVNNYVMYRLFTLVLHILPAMVFDTMLQMIRQKPRFQKIYQKVHTFLDVMVPFATQEWTVTNRNIKEIWNSLSKKDQKLFYCNLDDLNIEQYFDTVARGVRLYLANENEDNMTKAKLKRCGFLLMYYTVVTLIVCGFFYLLRKLFFGYLINLF